MRTQLDFKEKDHQFTKTKVKQQLRQSQWRTGTELRFFPRKNTDNVSIQKIPDVEYSQNTPFPA